MGTWREVLRGDRVKWIGSAIASHWQNAVYVAGLASVTYGCGLIYRPLWFICGGAAVIGLLLLMGPTSE